jgi:hypothetical protein
MIELNDDFGCCFFPFDPFFPFFPFARPDPFSPQAHGRKMAARQQALGYPVMFYEPREGGHGGVATPQMQAEREALIYTFLMQQLMRTGP